MKNLIVLVFVFMLCVGCSTTNPDGKPLTKNEVQTVVKDNMVLAQESYDYLKSKAADVKYPTKFKGLSKLLMEAKTLQEIKAYESLESILTDYFKQVKELKSALSKQSQIENQPEKNKESLIIQDKTHTVVSGDTLYSIARKYYQDASKWGFIFEANRDKLTDSRQLTIGTRLVIPGKGN